MSDPEQAQGAAVGGAGGPDAARPPEEEGDQHRDGQEGGHRGPQEGDAEREPEGGHGDAHGAPQDADEEQDQPVPGGQAAALGGPLVCRGDLGQQQAVDVLLGGSQHGTEPCEDRRRSTPGFCLSTGAQAGLKALYTCASWYAYAVMSGSSTRSLV